MDEKNINFLPLNHVKIEENINDYYNNDSDYSNGNKENINFLGKNEIKCKNGCFNIVDKWIARVVVKVPTGNNWHNIITREIALLKVRYPFLTEQQLRGKALMKFGIPSMCGNIIRTGAGKVTGAIAKELSQRKTEKKTRIPIAFKVMNKKIIPCINKFETKPETHLWIQENQRVTNLYNRRGTFTEEINKQNRRMENYWRQSKVHSIVENRVSRLTLSSSVNNETINNYSKNRFINESKKKIKYEPISPESQRCLQKIDDDFKENVCDENNRFVFHKKSTKKSLLSEFNNSDVKVPNKSICTDQLTERNKLEPLLREKNDYSQRFNNDSKKNNCDQVECLTTKNEEYKMKTFSPESIEFLEHFRPKSKTHEIFNDNIDEIIHQRPIEKDPKAFVKDMKINSKSVQLHSNEINYTNPKELNFESYAKKYQNQNFINKSDNEIVLQSGFRLRESQLHSPIHTVQNGIKRHYFDLTDTPSSPSKISKSNYDHQYHKTLTQNPAIDIEIHQYFTSQTISNKSTDEFPRSQLSLPNISQPISRGNSYLHTDSFNKLFENNDETKISISHSYTKFSFQRESSLKSNLYQNFSVSPMQRTHTNSSSWEKMTSEDFDYPENEIATQDSRTTCTLTPDIYEILPEINVPAAFAFETVSKQVSVDLLDRQLFSPFIHSSNNETAMNVDSEIFNTNYNHQQRNVESKNQKRFMLSDFCSEHDKNFKTLNNFILNNKKPIVECISMAEIKKGINKALEILEFDESIEYE
ncbi:hypothetical protein PV327_001200 [Microctonus hyperodae]|uniref:Uncharacterized protein n=1 Tax=Microctonus hyperodae TaxID=165561 RepID=A0AA39L2Y9_MICHY|nr:hypothetical protein PV327_001200 [Microctonus hyperodae]